MKALIGVILVLSSWRVFANQSININVWKSGSWDPIYECSLAWPDFWTFIANADLIVWAKPAIDPDSIEDGTRDAIWLKRLELVVSKTIRGMELEKVVLEPDPRGNRIMYYGDTSLPRLFFVTQHEGRWIHDFSYTPKPGEKDGFMAWIKAYRELLDELNHDTSHERLFDPYLKIAEFDSLGPVGLMGLKHVLRQRNFFEELKKPVNEREGHDPNPLTLEQRIRLAKIIPLKHESWYRFWAYSWPAEPDLMKASLSEILDSYDYELVRLVQVHFGTPYTQSLLNQLSDAEDRSTKDELEQMIVSQLKALLQE